MRHLPAIAIAATMLVTAACSDDSNDELVPPSTPTVVSTPDPSAQAELEAQQKAIAQEVAKRVAAVEQVVKSKPTRYERLSTIVTAYCAIQGDMSAIDEAQANALEALYERYWQAGQHWNRPLESAAKQDYVGACPDAFPTYPPNEG